MFLHSTDRKIVVGFYPFIGAGLDGAYDVQVWIGLNIYINTINYF